MFVWEALSRPGCQGPQRSCTWDLSTKSWKMKLTGRRKNRVDQGDGDQEEEVNGDVEAIRETHNAHMTHADEARMSADSNLSQCGVINLKERTQREVYTVQQTRITLTTRKRHLKTNKFSCGSVHSVHESLVDVLMSFHILQIIPHVVGLVVLCAEIPIHSCQCTKLIHF